MDSLFSQGLKKNGTLETGAASQPPENSIKRMAVLFTDIVASSIFFKTYGDVAGRRMLKEHEEIATPPILEHGGVVVKMLGDSLMAYFFHPGEAVKAAIKIQQKFRIFNRKRDPQKNIHVRIGVHFGEGILEEADIFGDVVNMAAKFLPFVSGDEVCISQAVYEQIRSFSSLGFEPLSVPENDGLPPGLQLYRVNWAEDLDLDPLMKTMVFMRPLFGLGKTGFRKVWELFLKEKTKVLPPGVEKESVLEDRSLALILQDPLVSLATAKKVIEFLRMNLGMDGSPYLPLQMVADIGPFLRGEKVEIRDLKVPWEELEPGELHVSAPVYHVLRSRGALHGISSTPDDQNQRFYRVQTAGGEMEDSPFPFQGAMIQGDLAPCFYCGDRRHSPVQCPSKKLTDVSNIIGKMGYLPLERINRLFFVCLKENGLSRGPRPEDGKDPGDMASWASSSFYELRTVHQLRLFRAVWNSVEEEWNKAKEGKGENHHGGLVWIAQDCLRVSNLDQAETILKDSLIREPEDYKPLCTLGFLHVDKGDLSQAKYYFKKALDRCQTNPQRILILFLLSRVYQLQDDWVRSEEMIRRILRYNPSCDEAVYADILLQFKKGKQAVAMHQLMKLIRRNREYYIHALIDPELAKFRELVHPKIKALLAETRADASKVAQQAKEGLLDLKRWLGNEERETKDAEALLSKIEELSKVDSYFSHLDVLHYGKNVVEVGRRSLEERRKRINKILKELAERHTRCSRYVGGFPYRFLIGSLAENLRLMQRRLERKWGIDEPRGEQDKFKDALQETENLSAELTEIESKLQRIEIVRRLLLFLSRFLKKTLIFQSANLMVAIILFPIVTYYLNLLLPGLDISSQNIWTYQKTVLSLGSVSGLLLALFTSSTNSVSGQANQR
jgi:class 3 adenylate cyclase/tetratricopeptide (TPR) repeat protein